MRDDIMGGAPGCEKEFHHPDQMTKKETHSLEWVPETGGKSQRGQDAQSLDRKRSPVSSSMAGFLVIYS